MCIVYDFDIDATIRECVSKLPIKYAKRTVVVVMSFLLENSAFIYKFTIVFCV